MPRLHAGLQLMGRLKEADAFDPSGQLGRHPRGTDEKRAASPSAIVG